MKPGTEPNTRRCLAVPTMQRVRSGEQAARRSITPDYVFKRQLTRGAALASDTSPRDENSRLVWLAVRRMRREWGGAVPLYVLRVHIGNLTALDVETPDALGIGTGTVNRIVAEALNHPSLSVVKLPKRDRK
jgi:hypothetical protein